MANDTPQGTDEDISKELAEIDAMAAAPPDTFSLREGVGAGTDPLVREMLGGAQAVGFTPREREKRRENEPTELEDLYELHPKFGDGEHDMKIRVNRISPQTMNGRPVAGFQGEFHERIALDEFARRFGPGVFVCNMMVPSTGGSGDASNYRSLEPSVRVRVPITKSPWKTEEDDNVREFPVLGRGEDPQVTMKKLEYDYAERLEDRREKQRLREAASEAGRPPDDVLRMMQEERRMRDEHVVAQLERAQAANAEKERQILALQREVVEARSEAANAVNLHETDRLRTQRENHERELRTQRENFEAELRRAKETSEVELRRTKETSDAELRRNERENRQRQEEQAERFRQDIAAVNAAHQIQMDNLRRDYDARLEDRKELQERDDKIIRSQMDRDERRNDERFSRELASVKEAAAAKILFVEKSADTERKMMQQELDHQRRLNEKLAAENTRLLAQLHKPTEQALLEAKQIASMTGMIEASEAKGGDESITSQVLGVGRAIIENGPEIIKQVMNRPPGFPPPVYQQAPPGMQPPRMMGPAPPPQPSRPMAQVAAPRQGTPTPTAMQGAPPRRGQRRPPPGTQPPQSPPAAIPLDSAGPEPPRTPVPLQDEYSARVIGDGMMDADADDEGKTALPIQESEAPAAEQTQQEDPPPEGPLPEEAQPQEQNPFGIDGETVGHVINSLNQAIVKQQPPSSYCDEIIPIAGKDTLRALVANSSPERIVEAVLQIPGGETLPVVTFAGREFLAAVFAELRTRLLTSSS